ncbi:hypothetical protein [Streptomyces sp. NPDC090022]|uniref:hypothetical protein n=1 Tax=Streptomyces sp. NPDC090022 TaxID=3365920 RepID=UPI003830ABD6
MAFVVFLTTSPTGSPGIPDVGDARFAPAYFAENLDAIRISALLTAVGTTLFLWFLAHLWAVLRPAEPAPGQGSMTVLVGGVAGSVLVLTGLALTATSGLSTTTDQAVNVSTLYVASALLTAFGGGVYSVFFFGVAKVIFRTGVMAKWLGWLAAVAALLCACAFMTPFFTANVLNAATGALGRWCWTAALVVWLILASGAMALGERRQARAVSAAPGTPEVA